MHQSTQQQYGAALPDSGKYENQLKLSWSTVTCITSIETCRTLAGWNCSWNFQPSGLLCPVINDVLSELEGRKKKNVPRPLSPPEGVTARQKKKHARMTHLYKFAGRKVFGQQSSIICRLCASPWVSFWPASGNLSSLSPVSLLFLLKQEKKIAEWHSTLVVF